MVLKAVRTKASLIPGFKTTITKMPMTHSDPAECGWTVHKERQWIGLRRWWTDEL